jgi:hypothetical protein
MNKGTTRERAQWWRVEWMMRKVLGRREVRYDNCCFLSYSSWYFFEKLTFRCFIRHLFFRQKLSNLPWVYQYLPYEGPGYYGRFDSKVK